MNTDSSADKDGDRRHAQTPGRALSAPATRHTLQFTPLHGRITLRSPHETHRGRGGGGSGSSGGGGGGSGRARRRGGAAVAAPCADRDGNRRHARSWARAHCHITLGRRTGEGKGGASGVAAEAAAGARNGGAEQRPLRARSLLRLRRSAPPARTPSIGSRVRRQAWRRGEARRRRRAREWSACGEADGRWPTGDEAREQPTPDAKDIERLRRSHRAVSGGARRSRPRAGCKAPALAPPRRAFFN